MASSVAEWLGCLPFFWSRTPNLKVGSLIPHAITSANLDFHCCVSLMVSSKASCSHTLSIWCGRLLIPWISKSVRSGFLSTNCHQVVKTRLFRLGLGIFLCVHVRVSGKRPHSRLALVALLMRPRRGVSWASTPPLACVCVLNQYRHWLTCQRECWRRVSGNADAWKEPPNYMATEPIRRHNATGNYIA